MDNTLRWFDGLREWGFSPAMAHRVWLEHRTIASPILWSMQALRRDPKLRAAAWAQRTLRERLLICDTPRAWEHYWKAMPDFLRHLERRISEREKQAAGALVGMWPVVAAGEDESDYEKRLAGDLDGIDADAIGGWDDLIEIALRGRVLDRLIEQAPHDVTTGTGRAAWQRILMETGLRSIRWGWLDSMAPDITQGRVQEALRMAQTMLGAGVGWKGQLLGLGGSTSLVLLDRGRGDGVVQPDPKGQGQTLTLDTWTVLAHEWAHLLDCRTARLANAPRAWATTSLLTWVGPEDPDEMLMAWLEALSKVVLDEPSEQVLTGNLAELPQWALRATMALGGLGEVREEIIRQQHMFDHGTWQCDLAEQGWLRLLDNRPLAVVPPQVQRTAQLLSRDTAFALDAQQGKVRGGWLEYLMQLPGAGAQENLGPMEPGGVRYLTHPVEIMARSFEAAMGCDRPLDSIWVPHALRPNAGLMWPLLAETRAHQQAWRNTLTRIMTLAGDRLGVQQIDDTSSN